MGTVDYVVGMNHIHEDVVPREVKKDREYCWVSWLRIVKDRCNLALLTCFANNANKPYTQNNNLPQI